MGRGSPICERVRKKIVEYFKNNVPQRQIAKALQISSSTVHNIIKIFRETEEISVRKGKSRRPLLDARGLRALRRHCITHRHNSVIDITKWAQEYFQKPLSVNTMRRVICRCHLKLYQAKRSHMWTWSRSAIVSCGPRLIWKWSDESKCNILVANHRCRVLRAKEEGDLSACYQRVISVHVLEGTMNAERYIKVLEQHMLPSRRRLFQGRPCVFQQDNPKSHTTAITTAWLHSRRVRVLNWPYISPIGNIWHIVKQKIRIRQPRTLQQLETYFRQEWDLIPTPKLQKLITSMPRRMQTVLKKEEMLHHGKHFLRHVAGIKFEMS